MDLYQISFAILVITSIWMAWVQHRYEFQSTINKENALEANYNEHCGDPGKFRRMFLPVYLLVMASDWLQGAYVYTLYKDEKGLAEPVVAALFTSGFLSAAVSALFVGKLADQYGRRLACLVFCGTYAVSCLTKIFDDVLILFVGRLLGGLSTTLMYSVFESWMVTEYYAQHLERSNMSLSAMFGTMTTLNSTVAIVSGVIGESLVAATGTKVSPFMAAIVCLGLAFWLMMQNWTENYGDCADLKKLDIPEKSTLKIVLQDKRILLLGFISCCFEGSMYIFVFYWSAAMESAHDFSTTTNISSRSTTTSPTYRSVEPLRTETDIPFGVIFATFMAAMMLGSLLFSHLSAPPSSSSSSTSHTHDLLSHCIQKLQITTPSSTLLTLSILLSSTALLIPVLCKSESLNFWAFCVFEACIGVYYPCMGAQKGRIVEDGVRAKIYSLLRIPLNVFVVVALTTTVEGDAHRDGVFVFCGGLLLAASVATGWFLDDAADGDGDGSEQLGEGEEERVE